MDQSCPGVALIFNLLYCPFAIGGPSPCRSHLDFSSVRMLKTCKPSLYLFRPFVTQTSKAVRRLSPGGRFENSPPIQGWDCRTEASSPEGTAELRPRKWECGEARDLRSIQPSLRDLWDVESGPGSQLPGYSQISVPEMDNAGPKWPGSSRRLKPAIRHIANLRHEFRPQIPGQH